MVRDKPEHSPSTFVPHHHKINLTTQLLEVTTIENGEVQPSRTAEETVLQHNPIGKEILDDPELFSAHLQNIDKEIENYHHIRTMVETITETQRKDESNMEENNDGPVDHPLEPALESVPMESFFIEMHDREGSVDRIDLDNGVHVDSENAMDGGVDRKIEKRIFLDSNKVHPTSAQKGKWKRIEPPPKLRDTMEIEEVHHHKRKFDTIEESYGEKSRDWKLKK